jgi:hypothetical protein
MCRGYARTTISSLVGYYFHADAVGTYERFLYVFAASIEARVYGPCDSRKCISGQTDGPEKIVRCADVVMAGWDLIRQS